MNKNVPITIGKVDNINIYEVTEIELSILEKGLNSSIHFNLAIACFSISLSTFFSFLLGGNNNDELVIIIVYSIIISSLLLGFIFLLLLKHNKDETKKVLKSIKARLKEENKRNLSTHELKLVENLFEDSNSKNKL